MLPVPKLLLFISDAGEQAILQETLVPYADLTWVSNPLEMALLLMRSRYDVVVIDHTFSREALEEVRLLNPSLPVITISPSARQEEWEEVLAAGAFDLLGLPSCGRVPPFAVEPAEASYEASVLQSNARSEMAKAS
jgi:CheY-like chemotaxis protein